MVPVNSDLTDRPLVFILQLKLKATRRLSKGISTSFRRTIAEASGFQMIKRQSPSPISLANRLDFVDKEFSSYQFSTA